MNKMVLTVGATLTMFAALAAEKLPTDFTGQTEELERTGSEGGLSWTGAARAYKIGTDTVLVFTDTTAGNCSFTIADGSFAKGRYLLIGGGGPGGNSGQAAVECGGGGAGGFVEATDVDFAAGAYSVTVGAGGVHNLNCNTWAYNGCGQSSKIMAGNGVLAEALGGGGGGIANGALDWKYASGVPYELAYMKLASGGGGGCNTAWGVNYPQNGGVVDGTQGHNGGASVDNLNCAGGGGGAGDAGAKAVGQKGNSYHGGAGGDGKACDITGEEIWYAGGGAGGSYAKWEKFSVAAGKGGGGSVLVSAGEGHCYVTAGSGVDTLGGGGAGSSGAFNDQYDPQTVAGEAGNGGNGVVVVRFSSIEEERPLDGLSFSGEAEWYNIGSGDSKETVIIYTNVNAAGSFTLKNSGVARVLLVGGGGAGGKGGGRTQVGGGGGAGGFLASSPDGVEMQRGTYGVIVGAGGLPSDSSSVRSANGGDSCIILGDADVFRAFGGGAGGNPAQTAELAKGSNGGSGGGGAVYSDGDYVGQSGGEGSKGQGNGGAAANTPVSGGAYGNAGGGGGAGSVGHPPIDTDREWRGGAGGDGLPSDITGPKIWYAGGGAGGTTGYFEDKTVSGGNGGGGKSATTPAGFGVAEDGIDGLGGGGAGMSAGPFDWTIAGPGRGGNGVVIVRVKKVYPQEDPLDGVSFTGETEWYNIGRGKTRETVVVYKNVEAAGTLKLERGVTARVLLVGGGGPGGNGGKKANGGGGGAGGFVELTDKSLRRGTYTITVGKGGEPKSENYNNNGLPSLIALNGSEIAKALGGGGGGNLASGGGEAWKYACGNPYGYCYDTSKSGDYNYDLVDVACGGGGCYLDYGDSYSSGQYGGIVLGDQGNNGGDNGQKHDSTLSRGNAVQFAGGGGGAGEAGEIPAKADNWIGGKGGNGQFCDITGASVCYAGGGAAGVYCYGADDKAVSGGLGGGGSTICNQNGGKCENGADGFGGGGAGSCLYTPNTFDFTLYAPGRGGNGVVIVRITKVRPLGITVTIH